jgi:hypothetical protein
LEAQAYWKLVARDGEAMLERVLATLEQLGVRYCVIGDCAVNAYVEPLVSLDVDLVIAADDLQTVMAMLERSFSLQRFAHSVNVVGSGSHVRVQLQTDPRYATFVDRAERRTVLGIEMPVAAIEDVLKGKTWAAMDAARRPSKRQKDLADIARLLEARPDLGELVPQEIRRRLV